MLTQENWACVLARALLDFSHDLVVVVEFTAISISLNHLAQLCQHAVLGCCCWLAANRY
jgi:hypothetical protein